MSNLLWSILAVIIISLLSFVGALSFFIKEKVLHRILFYTIAFAAGTMIGASMFHLLPDVLSQGIDPLTAFIYVIVGFVAFFVLEKYLHWRHCHEDDCETHKHIGWINFIGNSIHNMIDGMIIFGAFAAGPALGFPVAVSILLHEVPHELGDLGVFVYSGFSRKKSLVINFICQLMAVVGVFVAQALYGWNNSLELFLLPFAAGGLLYIAATDLVPEIHKDKDMIRSVISLLLFVLALVFMYYMKILFE